MPEGELEPILGMGFRELHFIELVEEVTMNCKAIIVPFLTLAIFTGLEAADSSEHFVSAFGIQGPPTDKVERPSQCWDSAKGERLLWRIKTGGFTGFPVAVGDKVIVGSNYAEPNNPVIKERRGVMSCYSSKTGELVWQATHRRLPERHQDMAATVFAKPSVDGDRVYYVSNRGELVCLDLQGFRDGQNDGPFRDEESTGPEDADVIWKLDMVKQLGVYKRDAGDVCSPLPGTLVFGDLVYCITGNGIDPSFTLVPKPDAPSFLAVNKLTGQVVWSSNAPGKNILYGHWSTPVLASVGGAPQIIFPGGDGCLYGFEPTSGKMLWKLDCNPSGATRWTPGMRGTRDFFVGMPTVESEMLYTGLTQDPESGAEPRRPLLAINLNNVVIAPEKAVVWRFADRDFGGTFGTPVVAGEVLYTVGATGVLFALDRATGQELWRSYLDDDQHQILSTILVHDDKVLVGTPGGSLFVFQNGRRKMCLGKYELDDMQPRTAVIIGETVYVSTYWSLWALRLAGR